MQSLRHAPHRLDPLDRPGRRTSIAVFSLRGDAIPAVVSLLPLPAGDIELNPRAELLRSQKTHSSRNGLPAMPGQLLHKRATHATFLQRLPPVSAAPPMEMSPTRGPRPPHRAPTTSTVCDSCQQPIRPDIRPLTCASPDCPSLVHSARRYSGLSARQARWLCRQHNQPNGRSETVAGRPIAKIQQQKQQEIDHPAHRSCGTGSAPSPASSSPSHLQQLYM